MDYIGPVYMMNQVPVQMPWMLSQRPRFTKQARFINESLNGLAAAQGRWYGEYLACSQQLERWSNLAKDQEAFRSVILYWQYIKNVKQPACVYCRGTSHISMKQQQHKIHGMTIELVQANNEVEESGTDGALQATRAIVTACSITSSPS
ncbi:hypothetical protein K492DRAFT_200954 [Lichtheimia hyalospora FSU 10163]|nr:hypothetical protein K492DRAFT_200954 [Lichtheimia hyalospora FSU 10163]